MLQDVEPWRTVFRSDVVISDEHDEMVSEVLMADPGAHGAPLDETRSVLNGCYPTIRRFVERELVPRMLAYAKDIYDYVPSQYSHDAFIRMTTVGDGSHHHTHAISQLSAVYYLEGKWGDIIFQDPRINAERGHPVEIRQQAFANFHHRPEKGSLIIFPSYVYHHVRQHAAGLRIAIPVDLTFEV